MLKKIRLSILITLTHKLALPLLRKVRRPNDFAFAELELYQMDEGTLGNDLYQFLEKRNLPLLSHYARHDIKHVLLGYDTTADGEVCLQSFMLGNGRISFPVLATVCFGLITMPEHWNKMKEAFKKGRACSSFHYWNWNEIVLLSTEELRNRIYQK